jgi:mono/diheme cytochrome c family protein
MRIGKWAVVLMAVGVVLSARPAAAQIGDAQAGAYLFRTYCASCHGPSALGDGPLAAAMRRKPSNLAEILKRNGGVFPADKVFRIIDGRTKVAGHGGPDMPVWGDVFTRAADVKGPEGVKARIDSLVVFLETIQQRAADQEQ